MSRRLLEYDPLTRTATYHHYDQVDGRTTVQTVQDAEPVIEANKAFQNAGVGGAMGLNPLSHGGIKANWWHVARIPNTLIEKWMKEDGVNVMLKENWRWLRRKLMDPEYRYLRTGTGKL